jgi:predicted 3-demethylubiquinone-9 3-methyltransferase (glyoxalase superfamily)
MARDISPFLMFEGAAEEAMDFYVSLFANSEIAEVTRYSDGEMGPVGTVKVATFSVAGLRVRCSDSPVKHEFTFTPSTSFFVNCESEGELDQAFGKLSSGGKIFMPPGSYGFSRKFAWVGDRFGVSWQLNLP